MTSHTENDPRTAATMVIATEWRTRIRDASNATLRALQRAENEGWPANDVGGHQVQSIAYWFKSEIPTSDTESPEPSRRTVSGVRQLREYLD